ncbi:MAG TPA: hypothetical protein VK797_22975 [Tepidisphaeraceae bacterium]|nr:hypothetical protein [Tepidisphaeraceae bacterium]
MHPHLKSLLVANGCDADASDDDAKSYYDGLSADKRADIDAKLARMMDGDGGDTGLHAGPPVPGQPSVAGNSGDSGAAGALPGQGVAVPATGMSQEQIIKLATEAAIAALGAATGAKLPQGQRMQAPAAGGVAAKLDDADNDNAALDFEAKRVARIRKLAALHAVPDAYANTVIAENGTFEQARMAILRYVHESAKPLLSVKVGEDKNLASLRAAMPQAIVLRAGLAAEQIIKYEGKILDRAKELRELSMLDMFRHYLASLGFTEVYGYSKTRLADCLGPRRMRQAFPRMAALAESTPDFGNITLDAINKSLRFNYLDAKRTWPAWAEKRFNPDFKNINRVVLSEAPNMVAANEAGEMQYVQLQDSKETYVLVTYKAGVRLTRNAIINDDLDAFSAIPRAQANSAARKEDDVAYAVITGNANMADGNAIFSAAHSNLTTAGSGGVPSVLQLQIGSTAMKKQKGLAGAARLELEPKFLLVPSSIEEQTKELIGSRTLIASQSSSAAVPQTVGDFNPYNNRYQVVGSVRLDDADTQAWFLVADFRDGQVNTIELSFLTDEPEPVIRQETDFDTEDVKYLVRHTVAGKAIDFRGVYKNAGH